MDISIVKKSTYTFPDESWLKPHQLEVLYDPTRFKVLCWARRHYKSFTALTKLILECLNPNIPPATYWYIEPTYNEAKSSIWTEQSMLFGNKLLGGPLKETIDKVNESELMVKFKNGSILQLKGGDNAERLLGANPQGIILDEYAMFKDGDIWYRIIEPILRANKGFAWITSTPKSHNHFHKLYQRGLEDVKDWKSFFLAADSNVIFSDEELETIRSGMPTRLFNQEYLCHFLSGSGSLIHGVKEIATLTPKRPEAGKRYVLGVDLGKSVDYTAVVAFDASNNEMVYCNRYKEIEWPFIKQKIVETARFYNNALIVLDATGLGGPIVDDISRMTRSSDPYQEDLSHEGLGVIGIVMSAPRKKELIEKLSIYVEQKRLRILNEPDLVAELEAFTYEVLPSGAVRYCAPSGMHDDYVAAVALAVSYLFPVVMNERPIEEKTPMQKAFIEAKSIYNAEDNEVWDEWAEL